MKTIRLYRPYRKPDDETGLHRVDNLQAALIVLQGKGHYVRKQMWKDFERVNNAEHD